MTITEVINQVVEQGSFTLQNPRLKEYAHRVVETAANQGLRFEVKNKIKAYTIVNCHE